DGCRVGVDGSSRGAGGCRVEVDGSPLAVDGWRAQADVPAVVWTVAEAVRTVHPAAGVSHSGSATVLAMAATVQISRRTAPLQQRKLSRQDVLPDRLLDGVQPAGPLLRIETQGGDVAQGELAVEALFDRALEGRVRGADAVRAELLDDRHVDEEVVAARPRLDQRLQRLLAAGGEEEIDVVVEDAAVADHRRIARLRHQLLGDLGVQDPRLCRDRRLLVDRQRTAPGDLVNHLDRDVAGLEARGESVAEGRLADPVAADEGELVAGEVVHEATRASSRTSRARWSCSSVMVSGGTTRPSGPPARKRTPRACAAPIQALAAPAVASSMPQSRPRPRTAVTAGEMP